MILQQNVKRIVLISDLNTPINKQDVDIEYVKSNLKENNIWLYVIGPNVNVPRIKCQQDIMKLCHALPEQFTLVQKENFSIVKAVAENCVFADMENGLDLIFSHKIEVKAPFFWYVDISVGNDIKIPVCVSKIVKAHNPIKFNSVRLNPDEIATPKKTWFDVNTHEEIPDEDVAGCYSFHNKYTVFTDDQEREMAVKDFQKCLSIFAFTAADEISEVIELLFYFQTEKPNGFMLYLGNAPGTKLRRTKSDDYMTLEVENGYPVLTMDVGNGPERIISHKYVADGNWYQAVIDRMDSPPSPLHIMYIGVMYIGGLPLNFNVARGAVRTTMSFSGCLGDATLNGMIINFANATDKENDLLGRCILDKADDADYSDLHKLPVLTKDSDKDWESRGTTEEPPIVLLTDKPKRGDGGVDDDYLPGEPITEGAPYVPPTTTVRPLFEITSPEDITEEDLSAEVTDQPTTVRPLFPIDEKETEERKKEDDEAGIPGVVRTTPPPSVQQCALPLIPAEPASYQSGFRLGTQLGSRIEFDHSRGRYKNSFDFSIEFKNTEANGLMFYVHGPQHLHYVAVFLIGGKVKYQFCCGVDHITLESDQTYNDGLWHTAVFSRNQTDGKLVIDERDVISGHSQSTGNRQLNVVPPFYLGGVPVDIETDVVVNIKTYQPFQGCLRNFQMNGKPMQNPRIEGAVPCSDNIESGTFFGAGDGYVKLQERFKVGTEIDIQMDIKPRNISGLLMSVHGKRDFLVLQMVDGVIKFTVDNGKGPIEAAFRPTDRYYFCDGNWHSIQAIKSKNVVSLSVDKIFADAGVGQSHSTDTRFSLFLGGHQHLAQKRLRGIHTRSSFVGYVKDVHVNNKKYNIAANMTTGDVTIGGFPTN